MKYVTEKADCWPNHVDEQHCEKLEQNECAPNEYRCFNGQCISELFLFDKTITSDCLDGTDEDSQEIRDILGYEKICKGNGDPSFRCVDTMCQHWLASGGCGRPKCDGINCRDKRFEQFDRDLLLPAANTHIRIECWATIISLVQAQQQISLVSHYINKQIDDLAGIFFNYAKNCDPKILTVQEMRKRYKQENTEQSVKKKDEIEFT